MAAIIPVRIHADLLRRIDAAAKATGTNCAALIRYWVETFVAHLEAHGKASLPPEWTEILRFYDQRRAENKVGDKARKTEKPFTPDVLWGRINSTRSSPMSGDMFSSHLNPYLRHSAAAGPDPESPDMCPLCGGQRIRQRLHPNRNHGCLMMVLGLFLTIILIGPLVIFYGIAKASEWEDWWLCTRCGNRAPVIVTRSSDPRTIGWVLGFVVLSVLLVVAYAYFHPPQ